MLQFKVVCFKEDIGMFTCYGVKITNNSQLPYDHIPHCPPPHGGPPFGHGPIPRDPHFHADRAIYNVVVYTNPELTQSIIIYSDKNINTCRLVLNNFIKMVLNRCDIIDLNKINDRTPIKLIEHKNDCFGSDFPPPPPPPHGGPHHEPWDKRWDDPLHCPGFNIFDETHHHPDFARPFHPDGPPPMHCPPSEIIDHHHCPPPDGHPTHFGPNGFHEIERAVTRTIPNYLDRILHEVTPPERKPENRHKVHFVYGNGGCAMGGSVHNSMCEFSEKGLADLFRLNNQSTFPDRDDKIIVKKGFKPNILPSNLFYVNMVKDYDWCFFMIPDRFMRSVKDFNWYYFEGSTNKWVEIDSSMAVNETGFTYQSNGIRYYYSAICMPSKYSLVFAKSGSVIEVAENNTPETNNESVYEGNNTGKLSTGTVYIAYSGQDNLSVFDTEDVDDEGMPITFTNGTATVAGLTFGVTYKITNLDGTVAIYIKLLENATSQLGYTVFTTLTLGETEEETDFTALERDIVVIRDKGE